MPKPIEIAIFDLDGTLLDTLASLAGVYNQALTDAGFPPHPVEAYKTIIGDGARVAAQRALPKDHQTDADINACVSRYQALYERRWQTATPYPGMDELLATLKGQMPLAVLSNKDQRFTALCVDHFFPGMFDVIVGFGGDVIHKPDPSGARKVAGLLGKTTDRTAMIGDTATDMNTAAACDMTGIGVLWGFRDEEELRQSGAAHIVTTPDELLSLLSRNCA